MNPRCPKKQSGYAIMLMVIGLMGIGGVVFAGFTQEAKRQVDHQKYLHNKRVLAEAKQALLQFAYNYPESINQDGPGRLPCADSDNNGMPNVVGTCTQIGRLPWRQPDLNLYDIRDADGQRLWYAVSSNFATQPGVSINSDTEGTITIRDQTGSIIYDAFSDIGVAAVIIAPGPETSRNGVDQDRSVGNGDDPFDTTADTDPGIVNPVNYLDTFFGIEDNAQLFHDTLNGFILGRVDDLTSGSIIVNDQVAIVTTREVIEVAQRATLQAYQTAINNYRANVGVDVYPWLDNYATTDLMQFDGDVGTRLGRVPSLFGNYFVNTNPVDTAAIISPLTITLDIDGFAMTHTIPASLAPDIIFKANGGLQTSFNGGASATVYFWDGHDSNLPSSPADGIWEMCPVVNDNEDDCNQNGAGNYQPWTTTSADWMKVRRVTITFSGGTPFEFLFTDLMATPLVYTPPTAGEHARVTAEYNNGSLFLAATWSQDDDFRSSFAETPLGNNGTFVFDLGVDSLTVGLIYYPELPHWAQAAEDNWHNSVQLAYAAGFQPGAAAACTPGTDCLSISNIAGIVNDKIAVLTLAAEHNLVDGDADGFDDELADIFDPENDNLDDIFAFRVGNDEILVIR